MELHRYFHIVRRWLWLILLCTLAGATIAFGVGTAITPVYQASATLLIQQAPSAETTEYQALFENERLARTYSEMLTARPIMENVIHQLGLQQAPEELARCTTIELVADTQLIRVRVEHTEATAAALAANTVAEAFTSYTETLQQGRYAASMESLQRQMDQISRLIEETEARIDILRPTPGDDDTAEMIRLEDILAGYRKTYTAVVRDYEGMRVTAARGADDVVLFEAAAVPTKPVRPRTLVNTAVAAVVGAMLGLGTAFALEGIDDTIKRSDDVERSADLTTIGTIGRFQRGALITRDQPLSPTAEAFRIVGTNIRCSSLDPPLRTLLVTSPGPVEGKSTFLANLAVALAQANLRVAVVDADLRRPRQHQIFGITQIPGLTSALDDGSAHRILKTAAGLSILPTGELPPNPASVVASRHMAALVQGLEDVADVVLIDGPPILPVTDAAVLSNVVAGVLIVVEVGRTRRRELHEGVQALRYVGGNVIGAVLTQVPAGHGGYPDYRACDDDYRQDSHTTQSCGARTRARRIVRP